MERLLWFCIFSPPTSGAFFRLWLVSSLCFFRCPNSKGFLRGIRRMRACSVANKINFWGALIPWRFFNRDGKKSCVKKGEKSCYVLAQQRKEFIEKCIIIREIDISSFYKEIAIGESVHITIIGPNFDVQFVCLAELAKYRQRSTLKSPQILLAVLLLRPTCVFFFFSVFFSVEPQNRYLFTGGSSLTLSDLLLCADAVV